MILSSPLPFVSSLCETDNCVCIDSTHLSWVHCLTNFITLMITDNESERGRYWLACVDYPVVRPTVDFHITADEGKWDSLSLCLVNSSRCWEQQNEKWNVVGLTIVANGKETNKETKNGKVTSHWHLPYPCPSYLTCFAVGDFILGSSFLHNWFF